MKTESAKSFNRFSDAEHMGPVTISESPESSAMQVHDVFVIVVPGGPFAEIRYGLADQMSVRINEDDSVASLFESADAEFDAARAAMRRGMLIRNAAWKLLKDRSDATKSPANISS